MEINVGDRITFRAATRWSGASVTRVVRGFDAFGRPLVRYGGWSDFVVRLDEISAVNGKESSNGNS